MAGVWGQLTSTPMDQAKAEFRTRMGKDTGLLKLGPSYNANSSKIVTEARLLKILPELEQYYELWLAYPDKFIELLMPVDTVFKLMPFQVLSLRINARHKLVFQTATRGYSKSFIAILSKTIQAILLPRSKLSVVSEFKQQATQIGREKLNELVFLMPLLAEEFDSSHGSGQANSKDFLRKVFKNKSELDIVSVEDSTRGGRRHSILFEEAKDLPGQQINAVVLPLLNIARRTSIGELNPKEPSQQQLYVGSAGVRSSFAYDKNMEILVTCAIAPDKAFAWGGDYKIPVFYGLLDNEFVIDQMNSSTYSEADFAREYGSKWTSEIEGSLFSYDALTKLRTIQRAEKKAEERDNVFYILSVDVARSSARTVLEVFKVHIGDDYFTKRVVNIETITGGSFLYQALRIKELDSRFNFNRIVIDANGLGVGLVDFLMVENLDEQTGALYSPYNIDNVKDYPDYVPDQKIGAPPKLFLIKTNQSNAGTIHSLAYKELFSGRVRLLVDTKVARQKLLKTAKGARMGIVERDRFLAPYNNTNLLVDETSNIKIKRNTVGLSIELIDNRKEKDTFSALEYGLYYISKIEQEYYAKRRRKKTTWSSSIFFS